MNERSDRQLLEALLEAMERVAAGIGRLEEIASRNSDATEQLKKLRSAGAKRMAKSRAKSRHGDVTPLRNGDATGDYRGKALALPEKEEKEPPTPVTSSHVTPKDRVWAFWQSHLGKASTAKFDKKRQRAVEARLRDGYSVDQLCDAIRGCKADPFSMGQNDRHQRFDDISLICRDATHVDKFIALVPKDVPRNGVVRLQPWEERAMEEEALLAKHGIGRPA